MGPIEQELGTARPPSTSWRQDLVDRAFGDVARTPFGAERLLDRMIFGGSEVMRLEEYVEGDALVIRAERPGSGPDKDVDVRVEEDTLTLTLERQERSEDERPDTYRGEFHDRRLVRRVVLPEGTTEADVTASYKDGILEVRMPATKEEVVATRRSRPHAAEAGRLAAQAAGRQTEH